MTPHTPLIERKNTDKEIWRGPDEGNGAYYADSLFITKDGALGMNCGGRVVVKPIRAWFQIASYDECRAILEFAYKYLVQSGEWIKYLDWMKEQNVSAFPSSERQHPKDKPDQNSHLLTRLTAIDQHKKRGQNGGLNSFASRLRARARAWKESESGPTLYGSGDALLDENTADEIERLRIATETTEPDAAPSAGAKPSTIQTIPDREDVGRTGGSIPPTGANSQSPKVIRAEALEKDGLSPQQRADIGIDILDGRADKWAVDVNLMTMIKNATSPMDLNKNAPKSVKDKFRSRMEAQIDAIVRQAFLEGALIGVDLVNEELRANPATAIEDEQCGLGKTELH